MKAGGFIAALIVVAFYVIFLRKGTGGQTPPAAGPIPPGPTSQDVPPDLSNYPISGAPAIPDQPGSRTNLLSSYPSLIGPATSTTTTAPATKPAATAATVTANQPANVYDPFDWGQFVNVSSAARPSLPAFNASGGFNSFGSILADLVSAGFNAGDLGTAGLASSLASASEESGSGGTAYRFNLP